MNEVLVFVLAVLLAIACLCVSVAYRHGVRDGFQNNWLPSVRKQIQDDGLKQHVVKNYGEMTITLTHWFVHDDKIGNIFP